MRPTASVRCGASPLPEALPKLLFDENLSPRLSRALAATYPASTHLIEVGLEGAADTAVWEYAAREGYVLVTKDEDFHRLSVFWGFPPKVVWVRLGNCSTEEVVALLEQHRAAIAAFVAHEDAAFLVLG